ncbi:MAG TPA: ABC-F family ATP-binding cassette domain-containing protein [Acidobacteriaceae bacterium]|jgi:ATP-binding cassette subfamily F protein uup|nr:ABC-F family ATP-binding cassette domain-containing protein [Acidobacteriaceae bacterium]
MAPLLTAQSISKRFGAAPLFENVSFAVNEGDRIGLIGPNGAGKSTLLALLAGEQEPDSGEIALRKRARVSYVRQESRFAPGMTVRGVMEAAMERAAVPQEEREQRLRETLGRAGFTDEDKTDAAGFASAAADLSGGWRKRLALVEAVVLRPDVLLLDEPTNHLDIDGIEWLEETLRAPNFALVVVTHDRYFLEDVASDVMELNRVYSEGLFRVRGSYSKFLEMRESYRESQERAQEGLRNRVRTEVEWLRRGPKARATKAKARIDNAQALIGRLADMDARLQTSTAELSFDATERQTKRLLEMEKVTIAIGGREIVHDLSFVLVNGTKLGVVGPNGSGKTTLLRAMTGELPVKSGRVRRAHALRIVYFSQQRELDPALTLRRTLAADSDSVVYQGRVMHIAGYAAKFLFTGDQLNQPVERLSGGERARVLLARLMLQPADVLILDEPTNDLDIPTLEILEEALRGFAGALVLVTHDRYLLDRVTDSVLGLDGRGRAALFASYGQWEEWRASTAEEERDARPTRIGDASGAVATAASRKKLSYMEQREYDGIEAQIHAADDRVERARARVEDPAVAVDAEALTTVLAELEIAQEEHDRLLQRWLELSEKTG